MIRFPRILALSAALGAGLVNQVYAADPNEFAVFNYDLFNDGSADLPGRLFIPTNYDPGQKYPLVLFFHGAGDGGNNNVGQVNGNIDNLLAAAKSRNFFLYAPQSANGWWGEDRVDQAVNMVARATQSYSIDTGRMYVTGLSAGGGGTWTAITNYRDTFAGAVPVCGVSAGNGAALVGKPIWAFHARNDSVVNVGSSRTMVNAIRAADGGKAPLTFPGAGQPDFSYSGNNLHYTEYATGDHYIWGRAYGEQPMYDWLLGQSNPLRSLGVGETILFDFGGTPMAAADAQGRTWNSTPVMTERTLGPAISYAKTTTGERTSVILSVSDTFSDAPGRGPVAGSLYPADVARDAWITGNWTNASAQQSPGVIDLDGLIPGGEYKVTIFGTDNNVGTDGRIYSQMSEYRIGDESRQLDINQNLSGTAVFDSVYADDEGHLQLTVVVPPGNGYFAGISALELTAVPEPGVMLAAMGLASVILSRPRPRGRASAE